MIFDQQRQQGNCRGKEKIQLVTKKLDTKTGIFLRITRNIPYLSPNRSYSEFRFDRFAKELPVDQVDALAAEERNPVFLDSFS